MLRNVLSKDQVQLLPLIKEFSRDFSLIGGTAIALQLGHRRSVDFDLITQGNLNGEDIRGIIRKNHKIQSILVETPHELTLIVNNVKFTFLKYPFKIEANQKFEDVITLPDLITLAAMKALALGRRAKWKDYVDLYFIFKKHSLSEVVEKAKEIFGNEFNEKLFREQLSYFEDIDYSETIDYLPGHKTPDKIIENNLQEMSLT